MALPANPTSPSSPFQSPSEWYAEHTQRTHRNSAHGQKRHLDDDADAPPTISGGFKRLRISPPRPRAPRPVDQYHAGNVDSHHAYHQSALPALAHESTRATTAYDHGQTVWPTHHEPLTILHQPRAVKHGNQLLPDENLCDTPPPQRLPSNAEDFMPIDDNPHRIFISDLDAAIAEIEAEERAAEQKQQEHAFFLPDEVDKEISSVPEQILKGGAIPSPSPLGTSQALVLYKDPLSISVPEEEDAVRRAVYEARQRIRERSSKDSAESEAAPRNEIPSEPPAVEHENFGYPLGRQQPGWRQVPNSEASTPDSFDPDAMDIE